MPIALEEFVMLIENSGILADDAISDFISPQKSPKDANLPTISLRLKHYSPSLGNAHPWQQILPEIGIPIQIGPH